MYYGNSGANKNLGIRYIKEAAGTPDNIGALTTLWCLAILWYKYPSKYTKWK